MYNLLYVFLLIQEVGYIHFTVQIKVNLLLNFFTVICGGITTIDAWAEIYLAP